MRTGGLGWTFIGIPMVGKNLAKPSAKQANLNKLLGITYLVVKIIIYFGFLWPEMAEWAWDGGPLDNHSPYTAYITWVFSGYIPFKHVSLEGFILLGAPQPHEAPWNVERTQCGVVPCNDRGGCDARSSAREAIRKAGRETGFGLQDGPKHQL